MKVEWSGGMFDTRRSFADNYDAMGKVLESRGPEALRQVVEMILRLEEILEGYVDIESAKSTKKIAVDDVVYKYMLVWIPPTGPSLPFLCTITSDEDEAFRMFVRYSERSPSLTPSGYRLMLMKTLGCVAYE
jgi:hypothetical protein